MARNKFEYTWVRVDPDKIWEDYSIKLLGVSIHNKLKFDKHVLNIIKKVILSSAHYQEWPNLWPSKRKGHFIKHLSSPNLSTVLWLECFMVVKLIIYKINRLQERALRLIYNDHISSFKELLSKDGTFTIHEQNIQNLAIEMLKALNDLDFLELF